MIDKLDVRIPGQIGYAKPFKALFREMLYSGDHPFRPAQHYKSVGDLRPLGYQAILHLGNRHGGGGANKIELLDAGTMSLAGMQHEIERIFDVDSRRLGVMRLDLAADVEGVPVAWFAENVRAIWKRHVADFSQVDCLQIGKKEIETIYFGKRPNCFRIYNKIAEWRHQYARMRKRANADTPPFEEVFGYPETGVVLTRVERQIGGARIPGAVSTVGDLRALARFNPFDRLQFLAGGEADPSVEEHGFEKYAIGMFLRDRVQKEGIHRVRAWLNRYAHKNAARLMDRYGDFLPANVEFNPARLLESYRDSISRQLAA